MMIAPVASRWNVSGMSIAVPAEGPSPGRTPISVPSTQPMKAYVRYCSVSAAARPDARCCKPYTARSSETQDAHGQGNPEQVEEDVKYAEAADRGEDHDREPAPHAEDEEEVSEE